MMLGIHRAALTQDHNVGVASSRVAPMQYQGRRSQYHKSETRERSSEAERQSHKLRVVGSIPTAPTKEEYEKVE